jgi:Tol biopolymer transport system component
MTFAACSKLRQFRPEISLGLLTALFALFHGGCASSVNLTSVPSGASVSTGAKALGTTPMQTSFDSKVPVDVTFQLNGYFPETLTYTEGQTALAATFEPMTLSSTYDFATVPDGAAVAIDGQAVGTTPVSKVPVVFSRSAKGDPWKGKTVVFSKTNYQTEQLTLSPSTNAIPSVELTLLKEDRVYPITAANSDGASLEADVTLNGQLVGKTPLSMPLTFQRPDKSTPWPTFNLKVEVPAKYKPAVTILKFEGGTTIADSLVPITEITTKFVYPAVVMTPTGAEYSFQTIKANAVLSTRETSEIVSNLKPVTNYQRQDVVDNTSSRNESINSFCVSPDGQNIVFSLTQHDEDGNIFSNLYIKRADDAAGGVAQLTQGSRYRDTLPYIANDSSNFLVFTSNRDDRNKSDIYRLNLVNNRLSGGISRLTQDNRFNFRPTYGDSNRQLFYLTVEPNFPTAESTVSSIRMDGSLPTQLPFGALEINNAFADKVFFVKTDQDTKKKQIYSITADGKLETALIGQEDYRKSNCYNPSVSPDGNRVLFVSDHGLDEQGRANNDIYLMNADGTALQRLTQNGSDDIMPQWSPSEEGVIYFLSNRGGSYNVWRLKLSSGSK